jgi:hypothetical protein
MSKHAKSIDDGPAAVLDLSDLTVMELATLVDALREAVRDTGNLTQSMPLWRELALLRLEVRRVFLVRFFELT